MNRTLKGALLLLTIGVVAVFSQQPAADSFSSIEGTVADPSGATIPGATVTLTNIASGAVRTERSNAIGSYRFQRVDQGAYRISAAFNGFQTQTFENVQIGERQSLRLDITLTPAASATTVEVVADAATLQEETAASIGAAPPRPMAVPPSFVAGASPRLSGSVAGQAGMARASIMPGDRRLQTRVGLPYGFGNYPRPIPSGEQCGQWIENEFLTPSDQPLSTFAVDVDTASYANVRRFLNSGQLPPPESVRIEELINYFSYDYPAPDRGDPMALTTQVTQAPWNPRHQLLLVGLRTPSISNEDLPPSNLTFLVDVSGSMSSADKLPLVQSALKMLAQQMRPEDSVSMVVYAGAAGVVLPPTRGDRRDVILAAIDRLQAGGSTNGAGGIRLAYDMARRNFDDDGNNRVILATDGDFNVGVSSDDELVRLIERERDSGVFLSVLSFGTGNLKDAKMEKLADHGNGNYAYIDSLSEARKVFVEQMGATLVTVAKDVKFQIEFNPARVGSYRLIGYENRLLEAEDFNDDTKDAGDLGSGHQVTAFYEIVPVGTSPSGNRDIDELRYQQSEQQSRPATGTGEHGNEIAWLKLRYKEPQSSESELMEWAVSASSVPFERAQRELRFAAAVAEYGLLLRHSEFAGSASLDHVMETASDAVGPDLNGHRTAFLDLVRTAQRLTPSAQGRYR